MEVKELPLKFGINKSFKINPIDPDKYLKEVLNKNISFFDGFKLDKDSYLIIIIYSNRGSRQRIPLFKTILFILR